MLGLMYSDVRSSSPQGKVVLAENNVMQVAQVVHASLFAGVVKYRWDSEVQVVCVSLLAKENELQVI